MAAMNTLKYGTLVLAGMATIGAWYYDVPWDKRQQVYMSDYVELAEGVRECQMIVDRITGTNSFVLQIATNRSQMTALDPVIVGLITNFVNPNEISSWVASYPSPTNPPHWTVEGCFSNAGVLYTNGGFAPYPIQVRKSDLEMRWLILTNLHITDSTTAWGSNIVYDSSVAETNIDTTAYSTTMSWTVYGGTPTNEHDSFFTNDIMSRRPADGSWTNGLYGAYTQCVNAVDASPYNDFGDPPSVAWSVYLHVTRLDIEEAGYYRDYVPQWDAVHALYKQAHSGGSAVRKDANLFGWWKSIPIARVDKYYYSHALLTSVSAPENTSTTWSDYVIIGGPYGGCLDFTFAVPSPAPSNQVTAQIGGLIYRVAADTNIPATNLTSAGSASAEGVMNVLHFWQKERCRP